MKQFKVMFTMILLLTIVNLAKAQEKGFGLGIIIGEPTGVSAKLWTSQRTALDFALGWSFVDNNHDDSGDNIHFHMDYLWHSFNAIHSAERFPLYYGIGGRFNSHKDEGSLAIRGVFGIAWMPHETPIDIFLEVAPSLELTPSTGFGIDAALGFRFYF